MKGTIKRVFALLLCLAMVASMLPTTILAEETPVLEETVVVDEAPVEEVVEEEVSAEEETPVEEEVSEEAPVEEEVVEELPEEVEEVVELPEPEEAIETVVDEVVLMTEEEATALMNEDQYDGVILSYSIPTVLRSGEALPATLTVMNTGATTWTVGSPDWMRLGTNSANVTIWKDAKATTNGGSSDANRMGLNRAVAPGETYTYEFYVAAKSVVKVDNVKTYPATDAGHYAMQLWLLSELGTLWQLPSEDRLNLNFVVLGEDDVIYQTEQEAKAQIDASVTYQAETLAYSIPEALNPGEVLPATVTVMNTGSKTWTKGTYDMRLSITSSDVTVWTNADATASSVGDANMVALTRDVAPGEAHTYNFYVAAKYMASKVDGIRTWADTAMGNYANNFRVVSHTASPTYMQASIDSPTVTHSVNGTAVVEDVTLDAVTAEPRTVRNATVTVTNNGTEAWTATSADATAVAAPSANGVYLKYTYTPWLLPNTTSVLTGYVPLTSDVAAGESAEFAFSFTSPVQEGDYTLTTSVVSYVDGAETAVSLQEKTTYTAETATAARAADAQTSEGNEADAQFAAEIVEAKVPTTMTPGSSAFVSFDVKNLGTAGMGLAFFANEPNAGYTDRVRVRMETANRSEGFLLIDWGLGSGVGIPAAGTIETVTSAIGTGGNGGNDFTSLNLQGTGDAAYVSPLGTAYSGTWRNLLAGTNRIFTGKLVAPATEGTYDVTFYVRQTNTKDISDRYTFTITVAHPEHECDTKVVVPGKAASCTESGLTDGAKCSVCGETTVEQTVIEATGHTEVTVEGKAASCTETGLTEGKKCSVCGETTVEQTVIEATGHTEVTVEGKAASCTETGLTEGKKCSVCGETTVEQTVIEATGHDYKAVVTEPTYNAQGYTTYTCSVCGDSYKGDYTDALEGVAAVNGVNYGTLAAAVEAAAEGATVTLLKSAEGAGVVINKDITIDFGGNTYAVTTGVGSTGTTTNGLQILKGNTVELKNGTLTVAEGCEGNFYMLVQNYANLTVTDMTLDGTGLDKYSTTDGDSYVLSINSGSVAIAGATNIIANDQGDLAYAFDACKYQSYEAPVVTVNTTGTIDGNVEVTGGALTIEAATVNGELVYTSGSVEKAEAVAIEAPADYKWVDGVLTACDYVAEVGGVKYESLAEAVAVGGEVTLLANVELTETLKVSGDVTLNLNGCSITAANNSAYGAIYVGTKGALTVNGEGTISNTNGVAIGSYGTVTVNGGTIEGSSAGLYNFCHGGTTYGKAAINGGEVNTVWNSGALVVDGGSVEYLDNSHSLEIVSGTVGELYVHEADYDAQLGTAAAINGGTVATLTYESGEVTKAETVAVAAPEGYKWVDGALTACDYVAEVDGVKYESLTEAVAAAAEGATVTMLKDTDGDGIIIDKDLTIDLGGYTYSFTGTLVGSTGTKSLGIQVLKDNVVTIKNGALVMTDEAVRGHDGKVGANFVLQNYADLTLENVDVTGNANSGYVVSINSGSVAIEGDTSITATEGNVAFDVCKYASYAAPAVTVNTTGTITGTVEVAGGALAIEAATINGELVYTSGSATKAETVAVAAPEGYKWVDGVLTACDYVAEVDGVKYESLTEAVAAAEADATVTLLKSAEGAGVVINKDITIDFGGNTYAVTTGVGSTGTTTNGLQILKGNTVELKNGTLTVAEGCEGNFYMLVQNYADLTVTDMTLDGTGLDRWSTTDGDSYVLSINSGSVAIAGATNIIANDQGDLAYAFDACKYQSYEAPVVTVNTTGTIDGNVELTGGALTIEAATVNGELVYTSGSATKAEAVTLAAPADYTWNAEGALVPATYADAISTNEDSHGTLSVSEDGKTVTLTAEGAVKCLEGTGTGITETWIGFKVTAPAGVDAANVTITRPDGAVRNLDAIKDSTNPVVANLYYGMSTVDTATYLIDWNSNGTTDLTVVLDATNVTVEHVYEETVTDPTCTEAGKTVYTCACGDSYEEEIAATGHTEETVPGTPATCTESGLTDGVVCSECGETITAQEVIEATGHTEETVPGTPATCTESGLTDGVVCSECGEVITAQEVIEATGHSYEDGVCTECGAEDPDAELVDANLVVRQQSLSLQEYVGMQFVVLKSVTTSYDRVYAVVERDGVETELDTPVTGSYIRYEIPILAAEMSEEVTFTLYGEKDGKIYKGESLTKSVRTLCGEKFSAASDATKKVIVDMLNYGAAVQTQFDLNASDLANANLTAEQLAYGSQSNPSMEGTLSETGSGSVVFQAKSLSLQDKVEFSLVMKLADASKADYEVRVTVNGTETVVDGADLVKVNASYVKLNVAVKATDLREVYTIAVYEKATGTQVSKTLTMDVAGLANSKLGADAGLDAVIYAMLNYSDSAAAL